MYILTINNKCKVLMLCQNSVTSKLTSFFPPGAHIPVAFGKCQHPEASLNVL